MPKPDHYMDILGIFNDIKENNYTFKEAMRIYYNILPERIIFRLSKFKYKPYHMGKRILLSMHYNFLSGRIVTTWSRIPTDKCIPKRPGKGVVASTGRGNKWSKYKFTKEDIDRWNNISLLTLVCRLADAVPSVKSYISKKYCDNISLVGFDERGQ